MYENVIQGYKQVKRKTKIQVSTNKLQQQFKTTLAIHQLDTKIATECHARKNVRDKSLHRLLGTQTKATARGGKKKQKRPASWKTQGHMICI